MIERTVDIVNILFNQNLMADNLKKIFDISEVHSDQIESGIGSDFCWCYNISWLDNFIARERDRDI